MIALLNDVIGALGRHIKTIVTYLAIVGAVCLLILAFFAYKTTDSTFCDSCHYMDPYVRHWQASTHSEVECVQCHDYGVVDLALSAARYVTGTYETRPKSNVQDESCLASDCHDERLLGGQTTYRNGILFDHTVHLEKPLRGEELRCSSCHNQIVQYEEEESYTHMTVNDMACFVCHFKDAGAGEAITGCDACHGIPEGQVEHDGFNFDHKPYLELGVECKQCHTRIVRGDGSVSEGKCYSCHIERERQLHSREELHAIHVTENGVDCFRCHSHIEHSNFEMVSALDIECESCHLRQHNRQKQLYMGIGGRGAADHPSSMFSAQVSCAGCHTDMTPTGGAETGQATKEPERASCVACHGRGYDLMYDNWVVGAKSVLGQFSNYLTKVRGQFNTAGGSQKARTSVREALRIADHNYSFLKESHLVHNIQYSLDLLNASADSLDTAMKALNRSYSPPSRGAGLKPENTCRTFCHTNMAPAEEVEYEDSTLPHKMHFDDMELACTSCHPAGQHGKLEVNQEVCSECH